MGHQEIINISINQEDIKLFNSYTHENTALKKTYTGGDLSELVRSPKKKIISKTSVI